MCVRCVLSGVWSAMSTVRVSSRKIVLGENPQACILCRIEMALQQLAFWGGRSFPLPTWMKPPLYDEVMCDV